MPSDASNPPEDSYRIGEVSRITGIPKDTLHFYSRTGLLKPDYVDPVNGYGYYSRQNMWQLDVITMCRKLGVPLATVRQIIQCEDNDQALALITPYRNDALLLADYYRRVADDLAWYVDERDRIRGAQAAAAVDATEITVDDLPAEKVIAGDPRRHGEKRYHANLQEAARDELAASTSIRRQYGYVLDIDAFLEGRVVKRREYLRLPEEHGLVEPEDLLELPAGRYATVILRFKDGGADFSPLLAWLDEHGCEVDLVVADELGLQLSLYIDDYPCEVKAHLVEPQA